MINNLDVLIDICVSDIDRRKDKFKECAILYRNFIEILIQKEDYTPDNVKKFQDNVDQFMEIWCSLGGKRMMTNYFHMLASGHIKYYMETWKNMYRYEQEGWESLNALIKTYFLHTKRGGYTSKESNDNGEVNINLSSRAGPIGKWAVRSILWKSGLAFEYLYN